MRTCEAMTVPTVIRRVGCMDILRAPNAQALFESYAEDCLEPGAQPQEEIYQRMEHANMLGCFGAYDGEELVGFVTVVVSVMPHNGKCLGSVESLFVSAPYRGDKHTASALLVRAADWAVDAGCVKLMHTARIGSELEAKLSGRIGFERTHSVFTEWL